MKRATRYIGILVFVVLALLFLLSPQKKTEASVYKAFNYQGKLLDNAGVAVADGNYSIYYLIYDDPAAGSCLWTARGTCGSPTAKTIAVSGGIFSTMLGEAGDNALPDFTSDAYYLEVRIDYSGTPQTLSPRKRIGSVPQALNANALVGDGVINLTSSATSTNAAGITVNSLTTGNGLAISSSSLSSGALISLTQTGTAAASNTQSGLKISMSGANSSATQTTYGGYITNTHTGTTSTNVGLYLSASGGTNNFALLAPNGKVAIGSNALGALTLLDVSTDPTDSNQPSGLQSASSDTHTALTITGTGNAINEKLGLQYALYSTSTTRYSIGGIFGAMSSLAGNTVGYITVDMRATTGATSLTEVLRIDNNGLLTLLGGVTNPTTSTYGITFGGTVAGTPDVNLYRSGENYLKTDDSVVIASPNITGTTTSAALSISANSLTTGTGLYAASSTLSSGSLVNLVVTGTAAAGDTQRALNISTSGANASAAQTTYGGYIANTHTGTTSTNVGLYVSASGGTTNYSIDARGNQRILGGELIFRQNDADPNHTYYNVLQYHIDSADQVGAIDITLPVVSTSSMLSIKISGYNYLTNSGSWEAIIGGYWYQNTYNWLNASTEIRGSAPFKRIRLMKDGSNAPHIVLGETTDTWQYPQMNVDVTIAGYAGQYNWASGWSGALSTDISALTASAEPTIKSYMNVAGDLGIGTVSQVNKVQIYDISTTASRAGLYVSQVGAIAGTGYAGYFSKTGAATSNVAVRADATGATTNYGLDVGAMTGATNYGININALSGATANYGLNIQTLSGSGTAAAITTGTISGTGATAYQLNLGAISGANATLHAGINMGNISGTTPLAYGINLGTLTGGTTSNYQINSGTLTKVANATNAQLNLGSISGDAASSTNYGINIGAVSGTGTVNYGMYVGGVSGATANYGIGIAASGTQTLWVSANADNTTAAAGLAFGSSRDTNLYRSATSTLKTDGSLSINDDLSVADNIDWAGGNTIYVPLSGDINTYITNATAGDTLVLAAGTYTISSNINVSKALRIKGQGVGSTIVDTVTDNTESFNVTASSVQISDLSITNTSASATNAYAIYVAPSVQATGLVFENIEINMNVTGNSTRAIYLTNASSVMRDIKITVTAGGGSGIRLDTSAASTFDATHFLYNVSIDYTNNAASAYGLHLSSGSAANNVVAYAYNCSSKLTEGAATTTYAAVSNDTKSYLYLYDGVYNAVGGNADVYSSVSGYVYLVGAKLINNTSGGTNVVNLSGIAAGSIGLGVAPSTSYVANILSTSTTASSSGLYVSHTGAISGTGYGGYFSKTGASTTNVGLYTTASGATTNYGLYVAAGTGYFGSDIQLAQISAPAPTTDKLYNVSGNLYWNGVNLSGGGALPSGTSSQTLRHDGANWAASSILTNDGTNINISSRLGIGTSASSNYTLVVGETFTMTSGAKYGIKTDQTFSPSGALVSAATAVGLEGSASWDSAQDGSSYGYIRGVSAFTYTLGTASGALNDAYGLYQRSVHRGSGVLSDSFGVFSTIENDDPTNETGDITNAYNFFARAYTDKGTGIVGTRYGVYVENATGGGLMTNQYGLYVADQTAGGTTDYGLAIAGADTQVLWLSSGADNTDAANGIAFGLSRDTNLYRSAANTLYTDDSFTSADDITATDNIQAARYQTNTWYVDAGESISTAVSNAVDGDVILLGPGTHTLNSSLTISKQLTFKGMGRNKTTLTSTVTSSISIRPRVSNIAFEDMTVTDTSYNGAGSYLFYCDNAVAGTNIANFRVSRVDVVTSQAGTGELRAFNLSHVSGTFENVTISATSTTSTGTVYGIYIYQDNNMAGNENPLYIRDSRISVSNTAGGSFGVIINGYNSPPYSKTLYVENSELIADDGGTAQNSAGLYSYGSNVTAIAQKSFIQGAADYYDVRQGTSGVLTLAGVTLANGTTTGTITYDHQFAAENGYFKSSNITGTTTGSALVLSANSLTSGTGLYAASSTLSSGSLVDIAVTGTAAASNTQKALNVSISGANATSTQTTYGGYFANTHTGTASTNVGLYTSASGGTNNYGLVVGGGIDWTSGNTIYVPIDGDINTYITNATAGDTLILAAGTYTISSNINVTKALRIKGQGVGSTTLSRATTGYIFNITASNVQISEMSLSMAVDASTAYMIYANGAGGDNLTGVVVENVNLAMSGASTSFLGITAYDANIVIKNVNISGTVGGGSAIRIQSDSSAEAETTSYVYNSSINVTNSAGGLNGIYIYDNAGNPSSFNINAYFYDCNVKVTEAAAGGVYAAYSNGTYAKAYLYGGSFNATPTDYDIAQANSGALTVSGTTLVNSTKSGTITYAYGFVSGTAGFGMASSATDIISALSTSTTDTSKGLNVSHTGAITGTGYGGYFAKSGASTTNVGIYTSALGATTNYGVQVASMTGATSYGLWVGNLSGATANYGLNIGTISSSGTAAGITIGAISSTGATAYHLNLGAISGANATSHIGINMGNISGTTPVATGINLGTLTGGTTSNYQINSGALTKVASATNAQLNLGAVSGDAASSTNYGINVGAVSGTGTANYGLYLGAVSGATANYSVYAAGGTGYFANGISIATGQSYTGAGTVTLSSAAASALTIDSGTTGAIDIGTGANAKTLTLGNTTTTTGIVFNTGTSGIAINLADNDTDQLDIQQGSDNYLNINTTNTSEAISFGNATTNPTFYFIGSGNVGVGMASSTTAKLHITEDTLGSEALRIETNGGSYESPNYRVLQQRVQTADGTETNLWSADLSTGNWPLHAVMIEARVVAKVTSSGPGTGATYIRRASFAYRAAEGAVQYGSTQDTYTAEGSAANYDVQIELSGTTVQVNVTGLAATNVTWHGTMIIQDVSGDAAP